MIEIVHAMQTPAEHFDYDLATYSVSAPRYARAFYPYPYGYAGLGWWGFSPWWGFGPPLVTTRILVVPGRRGRF